MRFPKTKSPYLGYNSRNNRYKITKTYMRVEFDYLG